MVVLTCASFVIGRSGGASEYAKKRLTLLKSVLCFSHGLDASSSCAAEEILTGVLMRHLHEAQCLLLDKLWSPVHYKTLYK